MRVRPPGAGSESVACLAACGQRSARSCRAPWACPAACQAASIGEPVAVHWGACVPPCGRAGAGLSPLWGGWRAGGGIPHTVAEKIGSLVLNILHLKRLFVLTLCIGLFSLKVVSQTFEEYLRL